MRRGTAVAALSMALAAAYAHGSPSHARFGADAFNRVVSAAAGGNTVFSPHSFEIDCAVFACAFDAIVKARYAEQLGAMKGIEQIYGPLHGHVRSLAATNRFSLKSARAMCLPDVRLAHLAYRRDIQDLFGAEVCMARAAAGVENWLRASMDGAMEDFSLPDAPAEAGRYSFYDLTDVRLSWRDPFPTGNTRRIPFRREDGSAVEVDAMCDLRPVEAWECRRFTLVRLPLADDEHDVRIIHEGPCLVFIAFHELFVVVFYKTLIDVPCRQIGLVGDDGLPDGGDGGFLELQSRKRLGDPCIGVGLDGFVLFLELVAEQFDKMVVVADACLRMDGVAGRIFVVFIASDIHVPFSVSFHDGGPCVEAAFSRSGEENGRDAARFGGDGGVGGLVDADAAVLLDALQRVGAVRPAELAVFQPLVVVFDGLENLLVFAAFDVLRRPLEFFDGNRCVDDEAEGGDGQAAEGDGAAVGAVEMLEKVIAVLDVRIV